MTIPQLSAAVFGGLCDGLAHVVSDVQEEPKGMLNYEKAHSFLSPSGERVCMLLSGVIMALRMFGPLVCILIPWRRLYGLHGLIIASPV